MSFSVSRYCRGLIACCLCLIALAVLLPTPTMAQDLRLTTSPLPINLSAKPGQTVSTELRIRNSNNQPETLKVDLLSFKADGQSGAVSLLERQPGDDYFDWVTFSQKQFTLAPNQWQSVTMTIKVPQQAAFGYYYAATFSRANPETDIANQQAIVIGSTATLVLLEVEHPNAKRQVELDHFTTDKPWFEFLPVTFNVGLRNTGNVHSLATGNIFISKDDQLIETLEVNPLKGSILPDSIRRFATSWSSGFPHYQTTNETKQLHWDFSQADNLRFGKYTANLVLAYDDGNRDVPLETTLEFWVIPWRLMIGGLVVGLLSLFGLFATGRSIWRLAHRSEEL